ncbi:MAG: FtsX-like permease family protein [Solirubrobacteraceae bacterium]|nr:FtsX-like permease family protein [Solirubrobacteraceae bacterium]
MLTLSLRSFGVRKLRVALTLIAVALGVALISGTYILTDTINRSFDTIFTTAAKGVDVSITPRDAIDDATQDGIAVTTIPASFLAEVERQPGVAKAVGTIDTANVALFTADGDRIGGSGGAPTQLSSDTPPPFSAITYEEGRAPTGMGEMAVLEQTAESEGLKIGDRLKVVGAGPQTELELVGIARFGGVSSIGGFTLIVTSLEQAQALADQPDAYSSILVAADPDVTPGELRDRLRQLPSPTPVNVRTGQQQADQNTADIREALGFLTTALLVFAGIALFVGAFIIFNTFSITVAQRMREFALLRTLGASRRQVMGQVIFEGLIIGLVGSILGLLLGLALAPGLRGLFNAIGADLPSEGTVVEPRTIIVSLVVGTLVTLASGLAPAIRATRVPPVAALREGAVLPRGRGARFITPSGAILALGGVAALAAGLFGGAGIELVGLGAGLVFIGTALLSPKLVPPLAGAIGRMFPGVVGRLARENSVRQPGRTAVTASALVVGVTLVAFVSIFAQGLKATIAEAVDTAARPGTLIVQNTAMGVPLPAAVAGGLERVDGVTSVASVRFSVSRVEGVGRTAVTSVSPTLPDVFDTRWAQGDNELLRDLGRDHAVVTDRWADDHGVEVGDELALTTPTNERLRLRVTGITDDDSGLFAPVTVSNELAQEAFGERQDAIVFAGTSPDEEAAVKARVDRLLEQQFPLAEALTVQEFKDQQAGQVNQILALFYVLLSLSVIVSLFGIVNTLVLSIYERTRELGMLRAIGTSRRQVRRMIRYEAVITALIGATMGIVLGLVFGVAVTVALEDEGLVLSIPVGQLVVLLVLGGLAGVLAAIAPARRASRLDVLQSLAYE